MNVAVVEDGATVRVQGDPAERFRAGSISKPVAALTALRLDAVDLDGEVNEQLRYWQLPDGDGVTARRLLSHTAGLGLSFCPGYAEGEPLPTLVQILDGGPPAVNEAVRIEFPSGSGFHYSGGGYVLLQLLLEDVSGLPFASLAQELVFEPLGMANSTFEQGSGHRYPEQAAAGLWTTLADLTRFVAAIQADGAMTASQGALPAEGEWNAVAELGMAVPREFSLSGLLVNGWFGHLGGAHDRFSAYFGSLEGGRAIVASGPQSEIPELFAAVLAAADEGGWEGLRA